MKAAEIQKLSGEDLQAKLKEARAELFNTARIKQVKKDIARIQTEMRDRELKAAQA